MKVSIKGISCPWISCRSEISSLLSPFSALEGLYFIYLSLIYLSMYLFSDLVKDLFIVMQKNPQNKTKPDLNGFFFSSGIKQTNPNLHISFTFSPRVIIKIKHIKGM